MHQALLVPAFKQDGRALAATNVPGPNSCRLIIVDKKTGYKFLVDTGADISVLPPFPADRSNKSSLLHLVAANGTPISVYGTRLLSLDIGLRRIFSWTFTVADVKKPIIGADFLSHYGLIVDLKSKKLIDTLTTVSSRGEISTELSPKITVLHTSAKFNSLLQEFQSLFEDTKRVPASKPTHGITHVIETKGSPVAAKARRLSGEKLLAAKAEFNYLVQQGICSPSNSCWSSPLHMVKKPDNSWRPCGDYRALNAVTVPDKYPISHLHDFTAMLSGKSVFSTLDLKKAFHQVPVAKDDIKKTAIITPFGLYEFNYMTFGLRNAAQTMQRLLDHILQGLDYCFVYIDDILIASSSLDEHLVHLREIFRRLDQHHMIVNLSKCTFAAEQVQFLGHLVDKSGITPLPAKVEAIEKFPKPTTVLELRRFLGILNFYRLFLPQAAEKQLPLHSMLGTGKKNDKTPLAWTSEAEDSFNLCKEALRKVTCLAHPDSTKPFALMTDASEKAIGACLQQRHDNAWQPLGFFSRKLSPAEQKYSAYDRELLAIFAAIKYFRYLLEGSSFVVFTDHKPLTNALNKKYENLTPRQINHLTFIAQFTSDIRHISGADNIVADAFSRIESVTPDEPVNFSDLAKCQEEDEELQKLLQSDSGLQLQNCLLYTSPSPRD